MNDEQTESRQRVIEAFKQAEYVRFFDNKGITIGYCAKKGFQFIIDEEYCRECQHPHVNERLRKEVAELRKENDEYRERLAYLSISLPLTEGYRITRESLRDLLNKISSSEGLE